MDQYFGTYHRFETPSKKDAALLLGADNLVGDKYDIEFVTESGQRAAWLRNRFGAKIGFFDADFSRQLSVIVARGWTVQAVLSFVAYTDRPAPGRYWGEVAVICFDPALEDAFGPFVDNLLPPPCRRRAPRGRTGRTGRGQGRREQGVVGARQTRPLPRERDRHRHHEKSAQDVGKAHRAGPQGKQGLLCGQLGVLAAFGDGRAVRPEVLRRVLREGWAAGSFSTGNPGHGAGAQPHPAPPVEKATPEPASRSCSVRAPAVARVTSPTRSRSGVCTILRTICPPHGPHRAEATFPSYREWCSFPESSTFLPRRG